MTDKCDSNFTTQVYALVVRSERIFWSVVKES